MWARGTPREEGAAGMGVKTSRRGWGVGRVGVGVGRGPGDVGSGRKGHAGISGRPCAGQLCDVIMRVISFVTALRGALCLYLCCGARRLPCGTELYPSWGAHSAPWPDLWRTLSVLAPKHQTTGEDGISL